jgi:hypothetical protein
VDGSFQSLSLSKGMGGKARHSKKSFVLQYLERMQIIRQTIHFDGFDAIKTES